MGRDFSSGSLPGVARGGLRKHEGGVDHEHGGILAPTWSPVQLSKGSGRPQTRTCGWGSTPARSSGRNRVVPVGRGGARVGGYGRPAGEAVATAGAIASRMGLAVRPRRPVLSLLGFECRYARSLVSASRVGGDVEERPSGAIASLSESTSRRAPAWARGRGGQECIDRRRYAAAAVSRREERECVGTASSGTPERSGF
jgi:hypothetical protein